MATASISETSIPKLIDQPFPELQFDIVESIEHARLHGFDPLHLLERHVCMAWDLAGLNQNQVLEIYERMTEFGKNQPTSFILVGLTQRTSSDRF